MLGVQAMKGARILVETCGAVKPKEQVVIITDTNKVDIVEYIAAACWEKDAEPVILIMIPRLTHGAEPPESAAVALKQADVVFAVTTSSLYHSTARSEACATGTRWINMPDFFLDMLIEGGLYVDFAEQRKITNKVASILTKGSKIHVITDKGTDLEFSISGRSGYAASGICDRPGMVSSPPNIETNVAPVEGTGFGKIVVDGSVILPRIGVLQEDIILTVDKGMVCNIEGEKEAKELKKQLDAANDPKVYTVAEFGIGLNPMCRITGRMLDDEGVYGTIHFGLGDNHTIGGNTHCSMHTDVIVTEPTIIVDDQTIMDHGKLL